MSVQSWSNEESDDLKATVAQSGQESLNALVTFAKREVSVRAMQKDLQCW